MGNRRTFIKNSSLFVGAAQLPFSLFSIPVKKKKLGVALVGLGYYSTDLLAPALQETEHCELKGIVTGSPEKIPLWQKKYGIEDKNVYSYENMHNIANNPEIDVVYIVLPNALHLPYAIIAANAGKHVWCEKPMATTVAECEQMIAISQKNKVQLTVGYRMQHEPVTQQIIGWGKSRPYGAMTKIYAEAGFKNGAKNPKHWKINKALGGGAMYDMGVYPLNAVRYCTGLEPISVTATQENTRSHLFDADETTNFELQFPNGIIATCKTTFADYLNTLNVACEKGGYTVSPFQAYSGVQATTSDGKTLKPFIGNQQAKQMDEDALAILNAAPQTLVVPGEEGLKDIKVVDAIMASASKNGTTIKL